MKTNEIISKAPKGRLITISLKTLILLILCLALGTGALASDKWVRVHGVWDPGSEMLDQIKAKIKAYVRARAKAQGRELKNWSAYAFQYQGQEENGRKYIFINAFCVIMKHQSPDKEIIVVMDGGSCFFNLKYNPLSKEFFDLFINGEA